MEILTSVERRPRWSSEEKLQRQIDQLELALEELQTDRAAEQADGSGDVDNNAAERAMRPLCVVRKNWMFAGSDRGAENAATIMTIIETAKLCGLNPQTYVADLLNRLPEHKINRIDDLAPWNSKPSQ